MIQQLIWVGLGGGLGSIARFGCQRWLNPSDTAGFPWGTFTVNITGCFIIGWLAGVTLRPSMASDPWKLFLMTGLCGGFTTFSAFTLEGMALLREQRWLLFLSYTAGSVLLGLLATAVGIRIGSRI
ncbi:MAG: fluoride efflux transporter CrcB [Bacteroidota bacterium]|jgi:CrcB protein